ncbi:16S rRNA (guanine(527)-N(7))-methyltransferase RsmG [Sporolituus thermophilus]|uniref:Ribosomal RNA small subunit methyltransferase G n=1 Tax=Sporolituus thermophilus DSM 23256 TaxID=1123285 RepID=A0A1G7LXV1_9FIRM|nr:16S rRNA (guanine(527)-N(7))-methyltransferase RsmG [Sporolituus thermophilus]SDF54273.1 16S rRNA (guanine527-N7)-methyltransferase [Sporolituus thermophilus DSM 23256]
MSFAEYLTEAASSYGLVLSPAQVAAFDRYFHLLIAWNEKMNLTAITDAREVAVKHMIDSLSCYDAGVFAPGCSVIDVGTGAGFPGIPLKIYRPDIKLTLLDSLNKRLLFLREVVNQLGLADVEVVHARAEEAGRAKGRREYYQVAVSRAVARLNVLAELCLPLVAVGGHFVALKGAQYEEEAAEAGRAIGLLGGEIAAVRPVRLPQLADKRAVIYIKKTASTPPAYPRRPGMPEKKPL